MFHLSVSSNADALSRSPVGTPGGEADEEVQVTVVHGTSISHLLESSPTVGEQSDLKEHSVKISLHFCNRMCFQLMRRRLTRWHCSV